MSFWVGAAANENEFIDQAVLVPGGFVPDKLRDDKSFNVPFPVILKPTAEIISILISDTQLRNSLSAYRTACELAFNNTGTGKTSTSFVVPWTAAYRISLRGDVTPTPIIDEIGLRYLYKATIRDAFSNAFGGLLSVAGEVSNNLSLYCSYIEAGLPIPDAAYAGIDCGGSTGGSTIFAYGVPAEPANIVGVNTSTTEVTLNWDASYSTDTNREGNVKFPFIDFYSTSFTSISSLRYPEYLDHIGSGVLSPNETVIVDDLQPGHMYEFIVKAKNKINPRFGPPSEPGYSFTDPPETPEWLNEDDCSIIENLTAMQTPYLVDGAYSLNGSVYILNILNEVNLVGVNSLVRTSTSEHRRSNEVSGATDLETGIITAYDNVLDISINATFAGFGHPSISGVYTAGSYPLSLIVENDRDYYIDNPSEVNQGFWRSYQTSIEVDRSASGASEIISFLEIRHVVNGTTYSTCEVSYAVDDINIEPVLSNVEITTISNVSNSFIFISGIPTYTSGTELSVQFNINNSANYFIRHDKKHADVYLVDSYMNNISDLLEVTHDLFNNSSHNYYYTISNELGYATSTLLVGNGSKLLPNNLSELIQFNDFTIKVNSTNAFSENVSLVVRPYNLYGVGNHTLGGVIDTDTGLSLGSFRFDTRGLDTLNLISNVSGRTGLHTLSGIGEYPCIENNSSELYDHTVDLLLDVNNSDMQLVNGTFSTLGFGDGYKDYSQYYWSNSSIITSDYSQILDSKLYVTFKYANIINLAKGCTLQLLGTNDFDTLLPEDMSLNIKLAIDGEACTGWLDANKIIGPNGARNFERDGTPCLDFDSNESLKHCYLPIGSTGDLYVRMGFNLNSTKRIRAIEVYNVVVNQSFILDNTQFDILYPEL